jgi:hypothetical protein
MGPVAVDAAAWSRLMEEHRQNAARLERDRPEPPSVWGFALGAVVPWVLFAAIVAWHRSPALVPVAMASVVLFPFGLIALFITRAQVVALGLLLGTGGVLFVANALYGLR